jgi:hypothetical protein
VLDTVFGSHAAHGFGNFPGLWTIINFGQDVAMNIDHAKMIRADFLGKLQGTLDGILTLDNTTAKRYYSFCDREFPGFGNRKVVARGQKPQTAS